MPTPFDNFPAFASDPSRSAIAVTKSDVTELTGVRALYVGGDGDVAVVLVGDSEPVTFVGVRACTILPLQAKKVMET